MLGAFVEAKTPEDKSIAMAAILQTGNPYLISTSIGSPEAFATSSNENDKGIYFQNQWFQGDENVAKFNLALQLATCKMGIDCGPDSTAALVLCSQQEWCGNGVEDAIRQALNTQSPGTFDEISSLAVQILTQIKAGNAAAFVH